MKKISTITKRRFIARLGAGCACWAVLAAPALGQNWADKEGPEVKVSDYGTVDLAVQDTDLAQVLEMLSIQGRKNIITSKSVSATVSANLYDVTFYEALDAILRVNGYGYVEEGNFIYVYTQGELEQIGRTESRIFELEHLSALDANEFITPLLSDAGQSAARGDVQAGFQPDVSDGGADGYAYNAKLVVNDYPENLETIGELLRQLDTPPQQVLIEATILQTALDEANAFGVDFSVIADLDFLDVTDPLSAVNNLLAGDDATSGFQPGDNEAIASQSTVGNTVGPAGLKVGVLTDEVAVFLKVLDEVTDTTVLARPKVMALNRQRAEVLVGARVGYLSTTSTDTSTTQTVQFLDTGIQLVFRPFISRDGTIRMELAPSVSEASLRTVTDAQGLLVTIPDELTNELTTNVRVQDGQTLVLGGLFRESVRVNRRQVPLLGDIPIVGAAFRGHDDNVDRDEIIFLITPSIVPDDKLWDMGNELLSYTDAIRVGARAGLLPFSREFVTSNYNRDAMDAFRSGDLEMALFYTNTSLGVNPGQAEMVKLREELTGERQKAHDRSMLERAFRRELGPLPPEEVMLPQEISGFGGAGASAPRFPIDSPGRWIESPRDEQDDRDFSGSNRSTSDDRANDSADGGPDEPISALPGGSRPRHAVTDDVPRILSRQGFWQAGEDPAGFDDPAWRHPFPFVTFEDMLEVAGVPGDEDSM
ncbi:MAG: hypothetical protein ACYS0G_06175 [Planctomycetota bacterium]|jgi:type IV pilus assembly protein PilQ